ncbi:MBL fold metallo-hydrolase [Brevibacillus sp. SYSU BS000544]|uniref:MBL fold metallo-hydrolase n=1 Tax=Brevibacillus sp. SYSU BS000544 TaxID=3416443 RepID=UPI003CE58DB1
MKIQKIKNRSVLFTKSMPASWDLNLHLILGDRYNYMIDTGLGSATIAHIKEYIKHDNKPIIVINTHYHWDHIWGNHCFRGSTIVSHKRCREMIEQNWEEMLQKYKHFLDGEAEMLLPNLTFEDELYFPEDKIRLIYTPGHTVDSISVIDEVDKVINVADNVGDSLDDIIPSLKCEKEEYRNTLLTYREIDFDTCISGHNIVLDKQVIEQILNKL